MSDMDMTMTGVTGAVGERARFTALVLFIWCAVAIIGLGCAMVWLGWDELGGIALVVGVVALVLGGGSRAQWRRDDPKACAAWERKNDALIAEASRMPTEQERVRAAYLATGKYFDPANGKLLTPGGMPIDARRDARHPSGSLPSNPADVPHYLR